MHPYDLAKLSPRALHSLMRRSGRAIDPEWLHNREYLGLSLGHSRWFDRIAWQTFKKVFQLREDGSLCGWNVAVEQRGPTGPWIDSLRGGKRVTYWYYEVHSARNYPEAGDWPHALMIDYSLAPNPLADPIRLCRDPLVSLNGPDLLLGYTYGTIGRWRLDMPLFFALARGPKLAQDVLSTPSNP